MIDIVNNAWLRVKEGLRRIVIGPRNVKSKGPIPGRQCLARDYAGCDEITHCPNCSPLEQTLRTAPWMEKNWRRVQDRKDSKLPTAAHDRE